jgi:hypothetical protein
LTYVPVDEPNLPNLHFIPYWSLPKSYSPAAGIGYQNGSASFAVMYTSVSLETDVSVGVISAKTGCLYNLNFCGPSVYGK